MSKFPSKNGTSNPLIIFFENKWRIAILIFLLAVSIRLATIDRIGKTWDEGAYVERGNQYVELALKHDFSNPYWYMQSDHPPLARYIYGLASILDTRTVGGKILFNNSYTASRIAASFMGSMTVLFIVLIGYKFFSSFVAISSGVIFALIPFFIGLSQLGTLESPIMLFFTATVFFFLKFKEKPTNKNLIITGLLLGCSLLIKQSNAIIIPLLVLIAMIHHFMDKKIKPSDFLADAKNISIIIILAFFTCFALWPMPFFHLTEFFNVQNKMWVHAVKLPPPEVYFGVLRLVPKQYYLVMFLITTPFLLLFLGVLGVIKVFIGRKFILIVILLWFLFPFLQMFYPFKQHGVRYIIEIYAPFALLCGIGLEFFSEKMSKVKNLKTITLGFLVIYLFFILAKITPYYLDYFNEIVGGNNYVYQHKLFQMGWWGQGIEEAAKYISSREKSIVSVAVNGPQPASVMPRLWNIKTVYYNKNSTFDYVIVPYFDVVRLGFPEKELTAHYIKIHSVMVDRAELVRIYKHIK